MDSTSTTFNFFATADDLSKLLRDVETSHLLQYVRLVQAQLHESEILHRGARSKETA